MDFRPPRSPEAAGGRFRGRGACLTPRSRDIDSLWSTKLLEIVENEEPDNLRYDLRGCPRPFSFLGYLY